MTFYIGTAIPLADSDFGKLAQENDIEEAALRAVCDVEANGTAFYSSGALVCLYEPHVAFRNTSGKVRLDLVKAGIAYPDWKPGAYPKSSFPRIDECTQIAGAEVACKATSWGAPQILGKNYRACGFPSALAMVESFAASEANQIAGMIAFIKASPKMLAAFKAHDWMTFASRYNGPSYAKNGYHTKLAKAYQRWKDHAAVEAVATLNSDSTVPAYQPPEPSGPSGFFASVGNLVRTIAKGNS